MNNDLISREALKEEISKNKKVAGRFIEGVLMLIDNAPTVEPEKALIANVTFDEDKLKEIVHTEVIDKIKSGELVLKEERPQGEWIYDDLFNNWKCSVCGECPKTIGYVGDHDFMKEHFKFCNHCGADMRGAE